MQFTNETKVEAAWTMGFNPEGREMVIVAIKATFTIPPDGDEPRLAEAQVPLVQADEFTGEPGVSSPLHESDFAHHKPRCDVLVNASAYAPPGRTARRVTVGLKLGPIVKSFDVTGQRVWHDALRGPVLSEPQPFTSMPISYDIAFGGVDDSDAENPRAFLPNPVGVGYHLRGRKVDRKPAPSTEASDVPVTSPCENYQPMSFGPVGRNWQPRVSYAGTYDEAWLNRQAPFWPGDFDYLLFSVGSR